MDISLKHMDYKYLRNVLNNVSDEVVECEFVLPEYMPEILRIIRTTATPRITSCRLVGERITIDGLCDMRIIYTSEDDGIYTFSQTRSFTRYCENSEFSECIDVGVRSGVAYVNCRATGTRRAELKAGISLCFFACTKQTVDVVSPGEDCDIEARWESVRALSLGCRQTKQFSMSDTLAIDVPCAFIMSTRGSAVCTEIRKINNKIMIKGDAVVDVSYVDASGKPQKIKHLIPINQIIEFEGMEEHYTGNVALSVCGVDIVPKAESGGSCSCFDISLGVDASVTMWEEKALEVITDAYAIGENIELKREPLRLWCAVDELRETFVSESNFTLCADGVSQVVDVVGEIVNATTTADGDRLCLKGSVALSFVIRDNSGTLSSVSKMMDFELVRHISDEWKNVTCNPVLTLLSVDSEVKSGGVSVRAEINAVGTALSEVIIDAVTDITKSDVPLNMNPDAITVYFPEKENESLWSIARKYNTTVTAIAEENCLDGDTTGNLKILFIPAV